MQISFFISWVFTGLALAASSDDVVFFISQTSDECNMNNQNMPAAGNSKNGGLCAYVDSVPMVWACSAPDGICWNWSQSCSGGNNTTPGSDQIVCNAYSTTWCCNAAWESCTQTSNQINICWSSFANPNKGLAPAAAKSIESSSLSVLSAQSSASANLALSSRLSALSSQTSSSGSLYSISTKPTSTSATSSGSVRSSAAASSSTPHSSPSKSISGGAIAGIAIGAVVGVLAAIVIIFVWRSRRAHKRVPTSDAAVIENSNYKTPMEIDIGPAPVYYQSLHEAPSHHAVAELSTGPGAERKPLNPNPPRQEMAG